MQQSKIMGTVSVFWHNFIPRSLLTVSATSYVNNRLHFIIERIFRRNGNKKKKYRSFLLGFGPTVRNELLQKENIKSGKVPEKEIISSPQLERERQEGYSFINRRERETKRKKCVHSVPG